MSPKSLDMLPLYADDLAIGAAVLGPKRASEWRAMAPLLEEQGLPKIDTRYGGRFVPSVRDFYDFLNGRRPTAPSAPRGGAEQPEGLWTRTAQRRRV